MKNRFEDPDEDSDKSKPMKATKFTEGNTPELPPVLKTETPINKKEVSEAIKQFLYKVFPNDAEKLRLIDFDVEFLCFGLVNGFIKIHLKSEKPKEIEVKLTGELLEEFVSLLADKKFGDTNREQLPPGFSNN